MAGYNYTLTYSPLSELIEKVRNDLSSYDSFGIIDSSQIVDFVVLKMYELGMRIYMFKEDIIKIENNTGVLPDGFYSLSYAFLCRRIRTNINLRPSGLKIEDVKAGNIDDQGNIHIHDPKPIGISASCCGVIDEKTITVDGQVYKILDVDGPCSPRDYRRLYLTCNRDLYEIFVYDQDGYTSGYSSFSDFIPLEIKMRYPDNISMRKCRDCMPFKYTSPYTISVLNGNLYLPSISQGYVYIGYYSLPYDEERKELLVPDNPIVRTFIEYAIKKKILENALLNFNDSNVQAKYSIVESAYREYELKAHSLVNMPNFAEMKKMWELNRRYIYDRFFRMYSRYGR